MNDYNCPSDCTYFKAPFDCGKSYLLEKPVWLCECSQLPNCPFYSKTSSCKKASQDLNKRAISFKETMGDYFETYGLLSMLFLILGILLGLFAILAVRS